MSMYKGRKLAFAMLALAGLQILSGAPAARAESGYQVIEGTRVFTEIDHARGVATFSNECGRQTLTQRQLQNGAIPDQIIPCPRPSQTYNPPNRTYTGPVGGGGGGSGLWGALAAGISEGRTNRVGIGSALRYSSRAEAEEAALDKCQESGQQNCRVVRVFNSGCRFITVGKNDRGQVGWGEGPSAQAAYDKCQSEGLRCDTQTIGGCL